MNPATMIDARTSPKNKPATEVGWFSRRRSMIWANKTKAIITPDKDIIPGTETLKPAYLVFENYELILKWNRSLRFALAVCTLKDKFKNEI